MAYADIKESWNRPGPIVAVAAIHAGIGYLLITGLGAEFVKKVIPDDLTAVEFPVDPPAETEDPKPRETESAAQQNIQVPSVPFDLTLPTRLDVDPVILPEIDDLLVLPGPAATPKTVTEPVGAVDPLPARPKNNPSAWITTSDYPTREIRLGNEGTARFRLEIAAGGTIESCRILQSSGSPRLDDMTCRLVQRRARFEPARNEQGHPVAGRYESSVRWVLPD